MYLHPHRKLILKKTNVETSMIKNAFDFEYHIYIYERK